MEFQPLQYQFLPASGQRHAANTLLLLHGTGGDENDLIPVARYFGDKVNILSVRGNVSENGMPRFFRRLSEGVFDIPDLHFRTHELVHFLETKASQLGIDPARYVAIGYSNGANIAGSGLVLYPGFLAGAVLFRPMQPFAIEEPFESDQEQPVLITAGREDPAVSTADSQDWAEVLGQNGYRVQFEILEAGHELSQQDIRLAIDWYTLNFEPVNA